MRGCKAPPLNGPTSLYHLHLRDKKWHRLSSSSASCPDRSMVESPQLFRLQAELLGSEAMYVLFELGGMYKRMSQMTWTGGRSITGSVWSCAAVYHLGRHGGQIQAASSCATWTSFTKGG